MMNFIKQFAVAISALTVAFVTPVAAGTTHVAVAANFTEPSKEIAALFKARTGHEAVLIFGASGAFYTQITHEAPFEVFLSADSERPRLAVDNGYAVPDSLFTYAIGKLALWSRVVDVTKGEEALKTGAFSKLAIANPNSAPYGTAAIETLKALNLYDSFQSKIVQGSSIAQAFQFVDTKNAEVGFVALSQIINTTDGTRWLVPEKLYTPIRQDAVLLKRGANDAASKAFVEFLKGPEARAVIQKFGYGHD
jgi:molybdate transport system substrate-binding protein